MNSMMINRIKEYMDAQNPIANRIAREKLYLFKETEHYESNFEDWASTAEVAIDGDGTEYVELMRGVSSLVDIWDPQCHHSSWTTCPHTAHYFATRATGTGCIVSVWFPIDMLREMFIVAVPNEMGQYEEDEVIIDHRIFEELGVLETPLCTIMEDEEANWTDHMQRQRGAAGYNMVILDDLVSVGPMPADMFEVFGVLYPDADVEEELAKAWIVKMMKELGDDKVLDAIQAALAANDAS
ncbi:MAG: hypothetical protein ACRCUJ_12950 [Phocaeicola sp.]